jgi:hypothetical protein
MSTNPIVSSGERKRGQFRVGNPVGKSRNFDSTGPDAMGNVTLPIIANVSLISM